jgi:hypothetical protein
MDIMKWLVLLLIAVVSFMGWKIVHLLVEIRNSLRNPSSLEGVIQVERAARTAEEWLGDPW